MDIKLIINSGAVFSSIGIILLIIFVVILLVFPVLKRCQKVVEVCIFYSTAPEPFKSIIKPPFLVIALVIIAVGLTMIRFGTWYQYKKP